MDLEPGYPYESQIDSVCQDIAHSPDVGATIGAIIIDLLRAFGLCPYDRMFRKIAASAVVSRVVSRVQGIP